MRSSIGWARSSWRTRSSSGSSTTCPPPPRRRRGGLRLLCDVLLFPLLPHATTWHLERQRLGGLAAMDEERLPVRTAREVLEGSRDASVGRPGLPGIRQPGNPGKHRLIGVPLRALIIAEADP